MASIRYFTKSLLQWIATKGITIGVVAAFVFFYMVGINQISTTQKQEAARTLHRGIMRAAMNCYAIEGRFPDSLDYLQDHYGIIIDRENYAVHYSIFASNIMPDVQVIEK